MPLKHAQETEQETCI